MPQSEAPGHQRRSEETSSAAGSGDSRISGWQTWCSTGVLELITAAKLRQDMTNQWLLSLSGASSVLLGLLMFVIPGAGTAPVVALIGGYAGVFGVLLLVAALRLRGWPPVRLARVSRQVRSR